MLLTKEMCGAYTKMMGQIIGEAILCVMSLIGCLYYLVLCNVVYSCLVACMVLKNRFTTITLDLAVLLDNLQKPIDTQQ